MALRLGCMRMIWSAIWFTIRFTSRLFSTVDRPWYQHTPSQYQTLRSQYRTLRSQYRTLRSQYRIPRSEGVAAYTRSVTGVSSRLHRCRAEISTGHGVATT
eukprot:2711364-Rhodomonas_salina.1